LDLERFWERRAIYGVGKEPTIGLILRRGGAAFASLSVAAGVSIAVLNQGLLPLEYSVSASLLGIELILIGGIVSEVWSLQAQGAWSKSHRDLNILVGLFLLSTLLLLSFSILVGVM